jgi:serine/threonine-protein kinase
MRAPSIDATLDDPAYARTAAPSPDDALDVRPSTLTEPGKRYVLRRVLGAGGMGEVRLHRDLHIGREVALKTMHAKHAEHPATRLRFEREARVQGQLEHPAIVPVYDLGENEQGEVFFTMKRVRGRTLGSVLAAIASGEPETRARFSTRRLLSAFSNVCLAVELAHTRGVLHRDIKPENVMLGDYGEVYLLDWGLARVVGAADLEDGAVEAPSGTQTMVGAVMGTPGYMSPEQARGAIDQLGPATDVYSLGAVLFEILAGEPLHRGANVAALLASTMLGVAASPSARSPHAILAPELDALCVKATALDPTERVSSARALSEAIERYLDGDRDAALRREAAARHAETASTALRAAIESDDVAARARASSEASRALALDPENREARIAMLDLLTKPPRVAPPDALASYERARGEHLRAFFRHVTRTFLAYGVLYPVALLGTVREPAILSALFLFWVSTIGFAYTLSRRDHPGRGPLVLAFSFATAAVAAGTSRLWGPLVFMPLILGINAMGFSVALGRAQHAAFATVSALAVPFVLLLERVGLLSPTTVFDAAGLHIEPQLLHLDPAVYAPLTIFSVVMPIMTGWAVMNPINARSVEVERAMHVQAWQLRQMVPERSGA